MSAGLFGLLDDVAAIARLAAASVDDVGAAAARASAKAAGVVVDDTAVTPQYVQGVAAQRELPIIKQIAVGSLRNKLLFILPAALLLSQFLPWLLTPLLMLGGTYLCYEGAEKVWERLTGHHDRRGATRGRASARSRRGRWSAGRSAPTSSCPPRSWSSPSTRWPTRASGPGRRSWPWWRSASPSSSTASSVLIVKMDDVGLRLAERPGARVRSASASAWSEAMPKVLAVISAVGTAAMLWVGGHILLVGVDDLGWHALYDVVHHLEEAVHDVAVIGAVLAWLVNTAASAVLGLVVGAVVVAVISRTPLHQRRALSATEDESRGFPLSDGLRPRLPSIRVGDPDDAQTCDADRAPPHF